jgi:hypothetical protein
MLAPLTYQTVVGELLRRIPSFAAERNTDNSYISQDDDSPYLVFADFSRFLLKLLSSQTRGGENVEETLARSFKLLDEMLTSPDPEVVNVAQVGVFEPFAEQPNALTIAKSYISEEANIVLDKWKQRWLNWLRLNDDVAEHDEG